MSICLRRRDFIAGLGGSAASWPLAARAQQAGKLPTIGFLGGSTAAAQSQWTSAFVQRLRELGWTDGRNVAIEYRWGEGRKYTEIAAEFVRLKVDVIVTSGGAALTLKQATSAIPIVFAGAQDPLGSGLVASLARPGGNLTGASAQMADIAGKRAELLRKAVPGLRRLAIMANVGNSLAVLEMGEAQTAARTLGLEAITSRIRRVEDILPAFDAFKDQVQALYVCGDPLVTTNLNRINTSARDCRRCTRLGSLSKRAASCPMHHTFRTFTAAPPSLWTRFCAERSPPTSRSSSRPSSSWSST
jgi:putative ABC transport system substrate-binding protein